VKEQREAGPVIFFSYDNEDASTTSSLLNSSLLVNFVFLVSNLHVLCFLVPCFGFTKTGATPQKMAIYHNIFVSVEENLDVGGIQLFDKILKNYNLIYFLNLLSIKSGVKNFDFDKTLHMFLVLLQTYQRKQLRKRHLPLIWYGVIKDVYVRKYICLLCRRILPNVFANKKVTKGMSISALRWACCSRDGRNYVIIITVTIT
ncbi:hypothetical protein ACJX0J_015865, partial [Zea mays]